MRAPRKRRTEITVRPTWEGGQLIGQVLQGVPNMLGAVLRKGSGDTGFNAMAHAVMKPEQGPWDKATSIPSGALFATKGQLQVSVDVSGASGRESDALAIAKIVMPRFEHPLEYDGAKAVALAPKPKPHPADACQFLPQLGGHRGDRAAARKSRVRSRRLDVHLSDGDCAGPLATYPVEFVWQGGGEELRRC